MVYCARDFSIPVLCMQWWGDEIERPSGVVHRPVDGLSLTLDCVLVRRRGLANEASNRLWRIASRRRFQDSKPLVLAGP